MDGISKRTPRSRYGPTIGQDRSLQSDRPAMPPVELLHVGIVIHSRIQGKHCMIISSLVPRPQPRPRKVVLQDLLS